MRNKNCYNLNRCGRVQRWQNRKNKEYKVKREARLGRAFFTVDGLTLAKALLGKIMVHETPYGRVRAIITETEAYMGVEDKGAHTYGGRRTERTEPMFHIGGTSYVYLIYGMYSCMNVVAAVDGVPQAVLLRMAEPADEGSREIMLRLRMEHQAGRRNFREQTAKKGVEKHLADGPGRLCIAMHISRADNDIDMVNSRDFYFTEGVEIRPDQIEAGKRIGIDYAEEAADFLWRFTVKRG
ncbi:MAG: DNA-3-methyladenine glycosylase [Lachnospiraceae bacterium]|nr:DNA-3-methyladenine glycosylase [Lachnospiraceae bacterium]